MTTTSQPQPAEQSSTTEGGRAEAAAALSGLAACLQELSRAAASEDPAEDDTALTYAVTLAAALVADTAAASLSRRRGAAEPRTLAVFGSQAAVLAQTQHKLKDGPSLTASIDPTATVSDLTQGSRWPAFTAHTLRTSTVRAVAALPLTAAGHPDAVLTLYSPKPTAYVHADASEMKLACATVALALTASTYRDANRHLHSALQGNRVIGTAIGILMHTHTIDADQAFDVLRHLSQNADQKLRDIAADVVLTGELPTLPRREDQR